MLFRNFGRKGTQQKRTSRSWTSSSSRQLRDTNPPLPHLSPGPQSQPENTRIVAYVGEHPTAKDQRESCGFRQGDEVGVKPARLPAAAVAPNTVVQLLHPATFHSPAFDSPSPPMLTTWNGGECQAPFSVQQRGAYSLCGLLVACSMEFSPSPPAPRNTFTLLPVAVFERFEEFGKHDGFASPRISICSYDSSKDCLSIAVNVCNATVTQFVRSLTCSVNWGKLLLLIVTFASVDEKEFRRLRHYRIMLRFERSLKRLVLKRRERLTSRRAMKIVTLFHVVEDVQIHSQ